MIGIVLPGERKNLFILFAFLANIHIVFNTYIYQKNILKENDTRLHWSFHSLFHLLQAAKKALPDYILHRYQLRLLSDDEKLPKAASVRYLRTYCLGSSWFLRHTGPTHLCR